ncbi:MAG: glucoamylase family protein, partial [archaeon]
LVLFSFSFVYSAATVISDADLLDQTEAKAANYFYEQVLSNGFVKDTTDTPYASTAATGFGLATLTIMAERYGTTANWIYTPTQLRARANKILDNIILIQNGQAENPLFYGTHGVLYHFIKPDNSNAGSEVSTVDTALLFAGAITAGDYFGGEVKDKANTIIGAADWSYFQKTPENNFNTKQGNTNLYQFTMSWFPTTGQNIQTWDMPTDESILVSVIALATNPNNLNYQKSLFSWPRVIRSYAGYDVVNSYDGTLFTYEFAHFFIDFNKIGADAPAGISPGVPAVDWWQNSINAAKANRQFCINNSSSYSSYGPDSWGLSSVYRPAGDYYGRLGALPNYNMVASHDGTVAPYSSISTMPFFKSEDGGLLANNLGFRVLRNLYDKRYYNLWSLYGPKDSFNEKNAISPLYLGLDQGPIAISIENYKTGLIMNQFMKNDSVKAALKKVFTCPNGVCNTQVTCSLNSQCSDNNSLTADICVNQGTAQSFCQYSLNVACSQNTQCNDFNMLTDDVCVNPGNHLSYCSFVPNGKTCVIPTTRMQITQSTDFCPGYYSAYDINIAADNIVVNCNGAMLTDPAGGLTRFIISGRNNVTIKNCIAGKVNYGVYITYSKSVTLMNNSFVGAYDSGVDVISSTKLNIINNILSDNEYQNGIYLYDVNDSNIENNTIKNNGYRGGWVHKGGLYLAFSYRNRFINNDISNNNRGLYSVYYSGNNYFANNKFCNNVEENTCGSGAIGNTGAGNTLPNKKSRFCSWLETNAIDCNQTCTETDGGYQKDIFSNLFYSDGFDTQIFSDYCSDENNLVEYSCNNIFPQKSPGIYCGAGCMNGACRKSCSTNADCDDNNSSTADTCFNPGDGPRYCQNLSNLITCRTDAECGINGWLNGTNDCNSNDVFQQYATYSCVNPGTSSSSCLSSNLFRLKQDCGDSNVSSWSANYCDGNSVKKQRVVHNNGCSVGACTSTDTNEIQVVQACLANQVCDVNQCLTPTCNTNAQCGTNGWVNSNYCSSTNIWGTYRTFACNNPGAVQANCSFNDVNQLKTTCFAGQFCSVGVCVNPVCTSDSQCNDNNVSTTDSCVNPGSAQSQCVFEPIIPCTNPTSNMQVTQS